LHKRGAIRLLTELLRGAPEEDDDAVVVKAAGTVDAEESEERGKEVEG
jgi:hypothetical protein